jgi:hypothetical protein
MSRGAQLLELRKNRIQVLASDAEHERICAAARARGLGVGTYLRLLGLESSPGPAPTERNSL